MKQEDYLMRILEQFGKRMGELIAQVLDLTQSGNYTEAHAMVDQMTRQLTGLPTDGLVRLPHQALVDLLVRQRGDAWPELASHLALLLHEDAQVYEEEEEETAVVRRRITALHIWLTLAGTHPSLVNREQIDELAELLADYQLPGRTYASLMTYFELRGQFGRAEDVLFDWLDSEVALQDLTVVNPIEVGEAFYRRLLEKSDEELVFGNLPRSEVKSGLAELMSH